MIEKILKRRMIVGLTALLIIIIGLITLYQLPRREVPLIEHPLAMITTVYPGATASQVEQYVTGKIEAELAGISGLDDVSSTSQPNLSQITVKAESKGDNTKVWNQVQQKLELAQSKFPDGVQASQLETDLQMQGVSIYQIVAEHEADLYFLNDFLEKWEIAFNQVPGISLVQVQGMPESEVLLEVNPTLMLNAGLSPQQITHSLQGEITPSPPGKWNLDEMVFPLRIEDTKEVQDLVDLPLLREGKPTIYLGDMAEIKEVFKPDRNMVTYQGKPSVSLSFFVSSGIDLVKVDREISNVISEMEAELPEVLQLAQVYTQADAISEMFSSLGIAFLLALFFVVLISSAGLNRYASLGVAVTIPLAICGGILLLPVANVDMNQISLIAFIIVLGILVDDAIVVNENISRHRIEGKNAREAVIEGTRGVASSVIVSTIIIVLAFSPLMLLSGSAGDFIRPLPTVIIATIIFSTLVALFFIPVYRHWLEERLKSPEKLLDNGWLDKPLNRLQNYYMNTILPLILNKPKKYVALCLLVSLIAYALIPMLPKEFFPDVEREEIFVEIELPESYSLPASRMEIGEVEKHIRQQTGVREVNTFYATAMPRIFAMSGAAGVGQNSANMLVFADTSKVKSRQLKDQLIKDLNHIFPMAQFTFSVVEAGPPIGAPISLRLVSDSLEELQALTDELKQLFLAQAGVISVSDDLGISSPSLVFVPHGQSMHLHHVNQQQLGQALRLYGEGIKIGEIENKEKLEDLRLRYKGELKGLSQDLSELFLFNELGQSISLDYIAQPQTKLELTNIVHYNYQRSNTIRVYVDNHTSADKLLTGIDPNIEELISKYSASQIENTGESAARSEVFIEIGKIFLIVVFLLLLVMLVQFNSIRLALIIMATVLLSSSGALYSLFITSTPLGFMALMGVVSLAGVVVRNGIILIEFMEERLREGMNLIEAIKLAGGQRLRPILLTTGTSFFGLMPLALGSNLLFKPLAICIAGGLLYSSILTLVLLPCAYYIYRNKIAQKTNISISDDKQIDIN
ncbi:MAG TPA: efflux RND transporter permease subunit [Syntrophomonadaceae bacterium]|nr:efflux RND transporter permease subunit [Syntrophomonadaceae bacterium]